MSGPNPIAVSEIYSLMLLRGIASEREMGKYLRLVQRLDQIFLKHSAEKSERKAK